MRLSQSVKLIIYYVLFGVVSFLIVTFYTTTIYTRLTLEHEAGALYRQAVAFSSDYLSAYYSGDLNYISLERELTSLSEYSGSKIWVIDTDGNVLLDTSNTVNTTEFKKIPFSVSDFNGSNYMNGHFYDVFKERHISVCSQVSANYRVCGYILIHKPVADIINLADSFLNVTYFTVLIIYAAGMVFIAVFWYKSQRILEKLSKTLRSYANNDFSAELPKTYDKDMDYISASVKYLSTELDTLEKDQQKFISNISHDFRSPLTSIRGYLEAIIDGTIPPEMQNKYLNIVLGETDRLTKLTSGLLELNQYGGHGKNLLDLSSFDIQELIRETARLFEGRCLEKHIQLSLVMTDTSLEVTADREKISRVLHNLIDNAIKFSHPESVVKVEVRPQKNKVLVSVKDSGIGIPKDDTNRIWERFYKTDLSRGKDKMGTGIGLSIVKEIITSHGETINVISTEGVGTEFIFSLEMTDNE